MIETSAVKYNGRRPASWRAAIKTFMHFLADRTALAVTLCTVALRVGVYGGAGKSPLCLLCHVVSQIPLQITATQCSWYHLVTDLSATRQTI